jgi:hypothetical protein
MNRLAATGLLVLVCSPGVFSGPPDFATQIIPVLTKAGCNAGACHGAAAGRGGLNLSLWGANPSSDYDAIVHALEGRRTNVVHPERSLLLRKPTGLLDHGGGVPLEPESPGARMLERWIAAGAPRFRDSANRTRSLIELTVTPRRYVANGLPAEVRLSVIAQFDDEPAEDVTNWSVLTAADPSAVELHPDGRATLLRRGQHVVVVRFLDRVEAVQLLVPLTDAAVAGARAADQVRTHGDDLIDHHIDGLLRELRLPASPPASDAEWLRRVTLDLTGRLPDPDDVQLFVADVSPDKRAKQVDALLSGEDFSDDFTDYWTLQVSRWLRLHSLPNEPECLDTCAAWLRQQIATDAPFNNVAHELITATGDSHTVGATALARMVPDARAHAELVGRAFAGVRLGCANCHNHPLDRWTQDDYHGLAAVFARLDRGRVVSVAPRGEVTNLRTGEPAVPRIPGVRDLPASGDHRSAVADWLISSPEPGSPPPLARAVVNRLWRAMFGRGLVEPVDDLRETNPATHPELLTALATEYATDGYRIRPLLRRMALSRAYARSAEPLAENRVDDRFGSHMRSKPLSPEVLVDAIADVTGVPYQQDNGRPLRAVWQVDPLAPAPELDVLGRCNRAGDCDEEISEGRLLPAQLHLLNGPLVNARLADPEGRLQRLISAGASDEQIVREFYLRALSRGPTPEEWTAWQTRLAAASKDERRRRLEDFVWALLNSRAFSENW